MWLNRLEPLLIATTVDRARAAEEGAKSAEHLLAMAIRSLDYTPPVELEFEDFLEAVYVADVELVPDDAHGYRASLLGGFEAFGIQRPTPGIVDLTVLPDRLRYQHLHFEEIRTDRDEMYSVLWENADALDLFATAYTQVERVRPAVRVGPDGFMVSESVADYVQMLSGTAAELGSIGLPLPTGIADDTQIQLWGGGALVFDQFGGPKYHHAKPLARWKRQGHRLEYLARNGLRDREGRYGSSFGISSGQWFAEFHRPDTRAEEDW
jgi:hypothetical protein